MSTQFTISHDVLMPILPDWTIRDLLEWLGDDTRMHDDTLRGPLTIVEAALTGSPWDQEPSTVALIRSIAATVQASPRLRNMRLDDLLPRAVDEHLHLRIAQMAAETRERGPVARFERMPQPQVA